MRSRARRSVLPVAALFTSGCGGAGEEDSFSPCGDIAGIDEGASETDGYWGTVAGTAEATGPRQGKCYPL